MTLNRHTFGVKFRKVTWSAGPLVVIAEHQLRLLLGLQWLIQLGLYHGLFVFRRLRYQLGRAQSLPAVVDDNTVQKMLEKSVIMILAQVGFDSEFLDT